MGMCCGSSYSSRGVRRGNREIVCNARSVETFRLLIGIRVPGIHDLTLDRAGLFPGHIPYFLRLRGLRKWGTVRVVPGCRTRLGSFFQIDLSSQRLFQRPPRDTVKREAFCRHAGADSTSFRPVLVVWRRHEGGMNIRRTLIVSRETILKTSYVRGSSTEKNAFPDFASQGRRWLLADNSAAWFSEPGFCVPCLAGSAARRRRVSWNPGMLRASGQWSPRVRGSCRRPSPA